MADAKCTNSLPIHEKQDLHKEISSSPKVPPRNKRRENISDDNDGQDKEGIKSKNSAQSAKPSPSKPSLPPRPAGLTLLRTPPKTSPNKPVHPPPPHKNQPPKPAPLKSSNEIPGLAKPHRPPQPSRQPSIKTASAPGRPKPPEIARSAPETPKSPVSISVSKVVKDANLKPKKPKPPEVSRTSGVVRATTLAPGKPNLSEASESSEAVKESTVAPDKAKPPEISRTSEVVKETTVTEDKSKPGEVPRTTSVSDKPKSVEEEKQSNEDKAPGHVPVKPKPPGAARTSEVVKAKTESLEIGRTSDVVKEKPIAQEKSESPELPKTSRDEEPIGRPQQKPKQTDGKLTEVVQETTPTREIPVPPEEMIISEPLTEKKESVQEQAEAVEAIARALVRQKLSEVSGTSTVGEGKVAPPEKPKPPKIPKSSEQVKEKRLAPEKPKSPEVTRSSGFANKTMPDTGRLKTVEVSQNSYVAKEKRTPPPKPKSPMVTRTSKIAQEIGKPKSAAVSGLSDKVKETRPAPPRQRSPEEASKTEEQKESEVGRVSEAVREKRRAPEKPKSPQVTRTAKDATSEPEKAKLAEVRKESDGIKEKRPAPEKPKSPETTRMTRVVEETAPVPVGTKSTEKSGTSVVMNETNSAQKPSTKKPDGKSLTEDKISENESHVCTDERILERNAHRRSLRCKPQRPPAPSSEVTTPTRVSIGVTMAIKETGKPDEHEPSVADDKKDVPNQKKLNRPPRPVAPHQSDVLPQHAKTAKNSETTGESQVTIVDDANQPDELPDEHEVTQQSDARQPDKSNKPLKPRRGSDIHDNASPRISRPSKPRRSESDVNACLTHTKGHPETGEETKARELPEASKVPKHVRPPPPKRTAAVKKINEKALNVADEEKPNESHNQLEKTVEQESEKKGDISNESDTGKEEPKIRFRVTSLTKTEVESFNMENFCVKSKNDERTSTKEEKKRNKPPPPLLPKPPRQRPPPPRLKKSSDKVEMEKKAEGKEWKVNERKTDGGSQVTLEEDDGRDELLNGKVVDENKAKETKMDKTKEKRVKRRAPEVPEDIQDKRGIEGKKDMKDKKNIEDNKDLTNEKAAAPKHSSIPGCGKGLRDTADTLIRNDDAKMTTTNVGVIEEQVRITVDLNDDSRKQDGGEREVLRKDSKVGEAVVASETMKVDDSMTEHPTDRGKQAKGNAVEERSLENTERDIEEKIEKRVSFTTENYLAPKEQVDQEMKEGKTNDVIIKRTFDVDKYLANEEPACDKGNVGKKSKDGLGEEDHLSKQEQELHAEGKKVDEEIADVQEDLSEQKDKGKTNYLRVQNGAEKNDQKRFRSMAKADLLEVRNAEDNRTGSSAEPLHEAVGKIPKEIDLGKEISEAKTEDQEGSILSTKTETVEDQKEVEEQQKNGICLEDDMNLEDSPSEIKTDTVCVENDREAVVVETEKNKDNSVTNDVPSMDSHTERNTCQGHVVVEGNAGDTQKQSGVSMDLKETRTVEDSPVVAAAQVVPVSDSVPLTEEKVGASFQDTGASRDDGLTSSEDANLLPEEISRTHSDSASPPEAENASHEDTCPTRESKDRVAKNEQVNIQEVTTSTSAVLEAKVTHVEISDQRPEESNVATALPRVQSPEKKMPPPKPKRTSSLKRDSQPLARMSSGSEEYLNQISEDNMSDTSRNCRESHNHVVANETASDTQDKHVVSSETRERNVAFPGDVVEVNESSVTVARSKSFSATGKNRTKSGTSGEKTTGTKDGSGTGAEGLARSLSFAGIKKMKKSQPPRPRPPTFFINESLPSDVTTGDVKKSDSVEELESAEESPKEESLSDNKHDSLTLENTTDSDSDREKVEVPQKSKTYYISKEILSTERTFVDAVKLVSEDFMKALEDGNNKFGRAVIPPETLHDILLNISQIYDFDREFLKALESRMETWDEQQRIGDIIKRFSPFLKMYKTYIQGYDNAMAVLSEALKKYPQFAEVVREFQFSERCQNLTVGMYMLKPIQRIPSYRLLLIDYLKHLAKDSLDYKDVSDALAIVSDVATHINEDMKRVDNFEEVLRVQRSLVGQVEIVKPGRELIKEGLLMKLCRKDMQPRMFYLFTDVLLYTTPVNNQFRMNLSLPLEEIKVEIPASSDFDNEFSIISTKKSFTLSASTPDERDEWLEALRNASDEIRKKKITFHLAKKERMEALLEAVQDGEDKNSKLGSKAPVWIPDGRVTMCMVCTDDFTVTNRRHHCRACGKVICGSCSSNSVSLQYLNDETARVCDYCYDELSEPTAKPSTTAQENGDNKEITEALSNIPGKKSLNAEPANKNKKSKKFSKIKSKEVPEVKESVISGYLRTRIGKKWHKRWYLLKDNVLYTSKASSDVAAQETRPLLGYDIRGPEKMDGDSKKIVFQLIHAGTPPVVLQTDNIKSAEQWVNALRRATILPL